MAEFMDANAFIVISIERQTQQILLAEAGHVEPAGPAHAFVEVGRIARVTILRHVDVNLVFADDNEPCAVGDHRLKNIRPARQQMRYDIISSLQCPVVHFR